MFCLAATVLLVAAASAEPTDNLSTTWYGYLNPGQIPTLTDVKNYYSSYGSYPTLTDNQYQRIIREPSLSEGFGLPDKTQTPSAGRGSSKKPS